MPDIFWKGTTQESFQQSLVEIGSVVSETKIVSGSRALPPRWPPECSCVVIESSFDPGERLQPLVSNSQMDVQLSNLWPLSLVLIELLVPDKMVFM
jgi:hypothetical protein